jgi:hypothetical protein
MMGIPKRLGLLASQCLVKELEAATRADRLRDRLEGLTVSVDLFRDDPEALESAKATVSDEYKRLKGLGAKEVAEARRWATRRSYAIRGMLLVSPDKLSGRDDYPQDLHDAAISAGVAYITSERARPLGHDELNV